MTRRHFCLALALAAALSVTPLAQTATPAVQVLKITGDVVTPMTIAPEQLKAMPRTRVEVKGDARTLVYEGGPVAELLKRAGVQLGADLRGAALATYVVAGASDGYQVVFSVGELDPAMTSGNVIVADTLDGKPLLVNQGPFRIVAPQDLKTTRSVRMLATLNVVRRQK